MSKLIKLGDEAREKLVEGTRLVTSVVAQTAGPRGLNGILGKQNGNQVSRNAGHT